MFVVDVRAELHGVAKRAPPVGKAEAVGGLLRDTRSFVEEFLRFVIERDVPDEGGKYSLEAWILGAKGEDP